MPRHRQPMGALRGSRVLLLSALGAAALASGPAIGATPPIRPLGAGAAAGAVEADPLARIAVVGASASAGFLCMYPDDGRPVSFDRAMRCVLADGSRSELIWHASPMFFTQSYAIGPKLLSQALAEEPTLLVAIDYLFWFGYGNIDASGGRLSAESERLELLEAGLRELEKFEGPIVVGDFPDMTPAIGLMLASSQVPKPETLETLNARLAEWAAERPQTVVLPLAELIEEIRAGEGLTIGERIWSKEDAAAFLLPDNLHPSPAGQIASATIVADLLAARIDGIEATDFDLDPRRVMERLKAP